MPEKATQARRRVGRLFSQLEGESNDHKEENTEKKFAWDLEITKLPSFFDDRLLFCCWPAGRVLFDVS